ncbi:BspA family leucine-rich repeat surface protein [Ruminococcus flavefaciens]|uniref:BspA family leucine-rich repeat surface protein n=1 Tax=Ruminococcus flavefaciens TaxID=1265 RepID=UPI0004631639|nr:BspA family leucine-rich repeat surface protein [Ruminococcus flavefaciens]
MRFKKFLSFALALTLSFGALQTFERNVPNCFAEEDEDDSTINYLNCIQFNKETGIMKLYGNVDKDAVQSFNNQYADSHPDSKIYKRHGVKTIVTAPGAVLPEDSSYLFSYFTEATTIDLSYSDTSNVTNMEDMFCHDKEVRTIKMPNIDTSKVTKMNAMFIWCRELKTLDLTNLDTSNVTTMEAMFAGCTSLEDFDLKNIDTSKVRNMSKMFQDCEKAVFIDLDNFDTSNVTNMSYMFSNCKELQFAPITQTDGITGEIIGGFNTSKVTNMSYMFENCEKFEPINLPGFDTTKVQNMEGMFKGCKSIKEIDLSNFKVNNVVNMSYMLSDCTGLEQVNMKDFIPSHKLTTTSYMFSNCSSLETIYVDNNWPESVVKSVIFTENMFLDCKSLKGGNGTKYNEAYTGCQYANIDTKHNPGYLTAYDPSLTPLDGSGHLGDVNNDGRIDATDASDVLSKYAEYAVSRKTPSAYDLYKYDVNGDGKIDAVDATYILSYYAYKQTGGTDSFVDYMKNH